jgi:hypothetical protein
MGEAYAATDVNLARQVAIKVLPEAVAAETLADRIAGDAIPIDEVLPIARQIAEALEAAHEQGSSIAISSPRT